MSEPKSKLRRYGPNFEDHKNEEELIDSKDFWEKVIANKQIGQKTIVSNLIYLHERLTYIQPEKRVKQAEDIHFKDMNFSHTTMQEISFRNCQFERCDFTRCRFTKMAFHNCSFTQCTFYKAEVDSTYVAPDSFMNCFDENDETNIGVHFYRQLMKNFDQDDQPEWLIESEFQFKKWKRLNDLYKLRKAQKRDNPDKSEIKKLKRGLKLRYVWEKTTGYGRHFDKFIYSTLSLIVLFWAINYFFWNIFGISIGCATCSEGTWDSSLYFTIISLSNLGYGDIVPTESWGKVWASFQAMIGVTWFAILASMLYKKISR